MLTKRETVSSKKGEFVIYKGISQSGATVELFLTPMEEEKYGLTPELVAEQVTIDAIFQAETVVEAHFNERGRLDSVEVAKVQ